jgi:hypothetical protein
MTDAGLSAFSIFFMQSPSFLEYQCSLEQSRGENNARTLRYPHKFRRSASGPEQYVVVGCHPLAGVAYSRAQVFQQVTIAVEHQQ